MIPDDQRAGYERRIREALAQAWSGADEELIRALGDPPDPDNVPAEFWAGLQAAELAAVQPIVTEMAIASALALAQEQGVTAGVNWALVNERAASWASRYTYELIKGIDARSQARLRELVSGFFKMPEQDLQGLGEEIGKLFGPVRGEMIATTEVTRAAAEGEGALFAEIKRDNPKALIDEFWLTSRDEIVCKRICWPLDGAKGDGRGNFRNPADGQVYRLPAHPRCRCARRTRIVLPKASTNSG